MLFQLTTKCSLGSPLLMLFNLRISFKKFTLILCLSFLLLVSLRNKMGEERRRQTLCDKGDNNFV